MSTPNDRLSLRVGAKSDRGKVREENQDRISRFRSPFGEVFIVADGMGGHEAGALAAELTISGLERHLSELPPSTAPDEALRQAAQRTNAEIYRRAEAGSQDRKMGATMVLALVADRRAWIAHAGDSRAYLFREGTLSQLTSDHTRVQQMLDHNMLTEEQARDHPDANIVTRCFGHEEDLEIEVGEPLELNAEDRLLLCSDGLSGYVDDPDIEWTMRASASAQATTDRLVELALKAGGEDNVSVQLLTFAGRPTPPPVAIPAPAGRRLASLPFRRWLWMVLLVLVAFVLGMLMPHRLRLPDLPFLSPSGDGDEAQEAATPESEPPVPSTLPGETQERKPTVRLGIFFGTDSEAVRELQDRIRTEAPDFEALRMPLDTSPVEQLEPEVIYFQPEFETQAQQAAEKLGFRSEPLPEQLDFAIGPLVLRLGSPSAVEEDTPEEAVESAPSPGDRNDEEPGEGN